jgi:DNA polymerase-1
MSLNPSLVYVEHGSEVSSAVDLLSDLFVVGIDIETTGLSPQHDKILLIQLGTEDQVFVFDVAQIGESIKELGRIISNPNTAKLGQNLYFEWGFLEANGLPLRGHLVDTMLAGKLLNLGQKVSNSLDALVGRHLGIEMEEKKELQKSFIGHEGPFSQEQLEYAARDVSICFPLKDELLFKLFKADLTHIWRLETRALPAFASMKHNGFLLDVAHYESLLEQKGKERDTACLLVVQKLEEAGVLEQYRSPETGKILVHPDFYGKGKNKIKGFNLGSVTQLQPALLAAGVPVEKSLDKTALAFLAPDHELVRDYLAFKELKTACSQVEKMIGHAKQYKDNRIRANYRQLGTDTGRVSCADPNLQQIKRDQEYRQGFIAPPGRVLVIADYSQLELRIAAECSGEERMSQAYREGADLHTRTAALMNGIDESEVTKDQRRDAKTYNFGALFGSGAKSIRVQAAAAGLFLTLEEAEEKLAQWKAAFPQLVGWQRTQGNTTGPVKTLMGRRRLLTKGPNGTDKYTTRLNTQVQGTGGDCMKAALAMLWEKYLSVKPEWKIVANIHDEAVIEVPEEDADEAQIVLKECMESAAYEVCLTNVPIVAEPGCGKDWSAK